MDMRVSPTEKERAMTISIYLNRSILAELDRFRADCHQRESVEASRSKAIAQLLRSGVEAAVTESDREAVTAAILASAQRKTDAARTAVASGELARAKRHCAQCLGDARSHAIRCRSRRCPGRAAQPLGQRPAKRCRMSADRPRWWCGLMSGEPPTAVIAST
jgi:hypothetical protein